MLYFCKMQHIRIRTQTTKMQLTNSPQGDNMELIKKNSMTPNKHEVRGGILYFLVFPFRFTL